MIKLSNVSFSYGNKKIIDNFSLEIKKGDRICLFGESGSGKTTLIKLILGLLNTDIGKVLTDKDLKPAVVFQENRLLPFKTVLENITLFGATSEAAHIILNKLGIEEYADKLPSSLSGGIERRAALARALSQNFDYLVLDEPFTGLDKENIEKAANLILAVCNDKPIILITHSEYESELLKCKTIHI